MTGSEKLEVYRCQTENLRELEKTWKQLQRSINHALIKNDNPSLENHTKLQALVFCAWSEVSFSKLIHTPYGFTTSEIIQIKSVASRNLGDGWLKCLDMGLRRVKNPAKSNYIQNIRKRVAKIINDYVILPRMIRNKVAHGQWTYALNSENTRLNKDMTANINSLNTVQLSLWKDVFTGLSNIIEALIESPNRSFHRDYWHEISNIEETIAIKNGYSVEQKREMLKEKVARQRFSK